MFLAIGYVGRTELDSHAKKRADEIGLEAEVFGGPEIPPQQYLETCQR